MSYMFVADTMGQTSTTVTDVTDVTGPQSYQIRWNNQIKPIKSPLATFY